MEDNVHEERARQCVELSHLAASHSPARDSFGMFVYCDVNRPCPSGTGGFLWFDSLENMFEMAHCLSYGFYSADQGPEVYDAMWEAGQDILAALTSGAINSEEAASRFNSVYENGVQISWWGKVDELFASNQEFLKELRTEFREDCQNREDDSRLSEKEIPVFLKWLEGSN